MRHISIFQLSGTVLPSEALVFPNYRTGTFKVVFLKDITSRHVLLCPFPLKPGPHSASSSHSCCEARKQSGNLFYSEKKGEASLETHLVLLTNDLFWRLHHQKDHHGCLFSKRVRANLILGFQGIKLGP